MKARLRALRIWQKLLISSLIYTLPIAVLLYFMVSGINANIRAALQEVQGNRVIAPLVELLDLIAQHRVQAWRHLKVDKTEQKDMLATEEKIDKAFALLLQEVKKPEMDLRIDAPGLKDLGIEDLQPVKIEEQWSALRSHLDGLIPEMSDMEHGQLISKIRKLISRIGDSSNLILDPDLDSYYMMDVVLLVIPQILDRLGEIMLFGEQTLSRDQASGSELAQFGMLASLLEKADMERLRQDIATSLREDGRFFGKSVSLQTRIPPALQACEDSMAYFLQVLQTASRSGSSGTTREEFVKSGTAAREKVSQLGRLASAELAVLLERRYQVFRDKMVTALSLSLLALAVAATLVFFILRGITRPLAEVMEVAREIAAGDIDRARNHANKLALDGPSTNGEGASRPGHARDEIWQLSMTISNMTRSLHSLIVQVHKSGIQVVTCSTEILASSRELEATAAQQAASTNEVRATSMEISSGSKTLAETVTGVMAVASETASLAEKGRHSLGSMESTMGHLSDATASIAASLGAISEKTGDISTIVSTITKVADQTNLLSLNASIEAEKAGKYGLGFSVVAREIRRLADQTAVATLDIEQMVKEVGSTVSTGVAEIDRFVGQVRRGVEEVAIISAQLTAIMGHVQALMPQFDAVNKAMQSQSVSADEISQAMGFLSEGAEQTREVVGEFNKVTEQLNEAVHALQNEVSFFKVST